MSRDLSYLAKYQGNVDPNAYNMPTGVAFPRISVGNNRFTAIDAEGEATFLSIDSISFVVIDTNPNPSKVYYEGDYDLANPTPPTCYSDNGFSPDVRVFKPQAEFCHECRQNQWGSARSKSTERDIKACADYKKLAIYLVHDQVEGLHQFRIPSASLTNWARYVREIQSFPTGGPVKLMPHMVLTRVSWSEKQNVLAFEREDFLDEDWLDVIIQHQNLKEYDTWIGIDSQSQQKKQWESQRLQPAPRLAAPQARPRDLEREADKVISRGEVIDVEPEKAPPAPRKKPGAIKAGGEQKTAPSAQAVPQSALSKGQSLMDAARQRAQAKINSEKHA